MRSWKIAMAPLAICLYGSWLSTSAGPTPRPALEQAKHKYDEGAASAEQSFSSLKIGPPRVKTINLADYRAAIQKLSDCYENDCGIGEADAKGPYFEIGRRIQGQLNQLVAEVELSKTVDSEISELARESLENSDGFVKEAAIKLLGTQPPSSQNLDALLQFVFLDSDAELIEDGFKELHRYLSEGTNPKILSSLREALLHGSPFVSLKIAQQIRQILTVHNLNYFRDVALEIETGSRVRMELENALAILKQ